MDSTANHCPECGQEIALENDPYLGREIKGAYRIHELIGAGAMGRVYAAEQLSLKKKVAIKVLHKNFAQDKAAAARFEREAMAASRLTHPNSITVIDFGKSEQGNLYLVTEFIKGQSFADQITREGAVEPRRLALILIQVCSALVEAHGQGVVHRDIKPENIMVLKQRDGRDLVKVLDFGIAQIQSSEDANAPKLTRAGLVCGTPEYMSPEQARGAKVDERTDIYSLGVVMFEALTCELLFQAPSAVDILSKHLSEMPDPPSTRRPDLAIPAVLDGICLKAVAKDVGERYATALEMQEALERAITTIDQGAIEEATVVEVDEPAPATAVVQPARSPSDAPAQFSGTGASMPGPASMAPAPVQPLGGLPPATPSGGATTTPPSALPRAAAATTDTTSYSATSPDSLGSGRIDVVDHSRAEATGRISVNALRESYRRAIDQADGAAAPTPSSQVASDPAQARRRQHNTSASRTNLEPIRPPGTEPALDTLEVRREPSTVRRVSAFTDPGAASRERPGRKGLMFFLAVAVVLLFGAGTYMLLKVFATGADVTGGVDTPRTTAPRASSRKLPAAKTVSFDELSPKLKALYRKGNKQMVKGRYNQAAKIYRLVIRAAPGFADAYRQVGTCYLELKKKRLAANAFEDFLNLSPANKHAEMIRKTLAEIRAKK